MVLVVLPREPPAERHRGSVSAVLLVDQTHFCLHVYTTVQEFYKHSIAMLQNRKCLPKAHVTVVFNTHAQQFQPFSSPGTHGVIESVCCLYPLKSCYSQVSCEEETLRTSLLCFFLQPWCV